MRSQQLPIITPPFFEKVSMYSGTREECICLRVYMMTHGWVSIQPSQPKQVLLLYIYMYFFF